MKHVFRLAAAAMLAFGAATAQAAVVSMSDTVARVDHAYGFEDLPFTSNFGPTVSRNNITVTQILGDIDGISTQPFLNGVEGLRNWYANGGDNGYTAIRTTNGADLVALSLLTGHGNLAIRNAFYSLRRDGAEVASGSFANSRGFTPITFSGVAFDEVYLVNLVSQTSTFSFFGDGSANSLAIDDIKMQLETPPSVPLPAGGLLLLTGAGALTLMRRRRG